MKEETIGMFEAKTRFSEIVATVVREGRRVIVTRRGKPVVQISRCPGDEDRQASRKRALEELRELRKELPKMTKQEITDLIREGRGE